MMKWEVGGAGFIIVDLIQKKTESFSFIESVQLFLHTHPTITKHGVINLLTEMW